MVGSHCMIDEIVMIPRVDSIGSLRNSGEDLILCREYEVRGSE